MILLPLRFSWGNRLRGQGTIIIWQCPWFIPQDFWNLKVRPSSTIACHLTSLWNPKAVRKKGTQSKAGPKWLGIRKKGASWWLGTALPWVGPWTIDLDICGGRKWKGIAVRERTSATSWSAWLNTLLPREVITFHQHKCLWFPSTPEGSHGSPGLCSPVLLLLTCTLFLI